MVCINHWHYGKMPTFCMGLLSGGKNMSRRKIVQRPESSRLSDTGSQVQAETALKIEEAPLLAEGRLRRRHRLKIKLNVRRKKHYAVALYGDSISKGIVLDEESGRYRVLPDNYASLVGQRLKGTLFNRAM